MPHINRWVSPDHPIGQSLMAARTRLQLAAWRPRTDKERQLKAIIARVSPAFTMVDLSRLRTLARLAQDVHRRAVGGAVVECGTWRGGALALIDWTLRELGDERDLWGFDSFEGLPAPGGRDDRAIHRGFFNGWCAAAEEDVQAAILTAGGNGGHLHLVKGWLSQTLPVTATGPIAFLHIDVDWYESVKTALDTLFDRLSPGGIVTIDDYGRWSGCDDAVDEFLLARGLPAGSLNRAGRYGAWFVKT